MTQNTHRFCTPTFKQLGILLLLTLLVVGEDPDESRSYFDPKGVLVAREQLYPYGGHCEYKIYPYTPCPHSNLSIIKCQKKWNHWIVDRLLPQGGTVVYQKCSHSQLAESKRDLCRHKSFKDIHPETNATVCKCNVDDCATSGKHWQMTGSNHRLTSDDVARNISAVSRAPPLHVSWERVKVSCPATIAYFGYDHFWIKYTLAFKTKTTVCHGDGHTKCTTTVGYFRDGGIRQNATTVTLPPPSEVTGAQEGVYFVQSCHRSDINDSMAMRSRHFWGFDDLEIYSYPRTYPYCIETDTSETTPQYTCCCQDNNDMCSNQVQFHGYDEPHLDTFSLGNQLLSGIYKLHYRHFLKTVVGHPAAFPLPTTEPPPPTDGQTTQPLTTPPPSVGTTTLPRVWRRTGDPASRRDDDHPDDSSAAPPVPRASIPAGARALVALWTFIAVQHFY